MKFLSRFINVTARSNHIAGRRDSAVSVKPSISSKRKTASKSAIVEICKKVFAAEVLFIIGYNIMIYPYVNATQNDFGTSMQIFSSSAAIVEVQPLEFPSQIKGKKTNLLVAPDDPSAANLSILGSPNQFVIARVVESKIWLTKAGTPGTNQEDKIKADQFKMGGPNLRTWFGNAAWGRIPPSGAITDVRVGATARIKPYHTEGSYSGKATMRVVYL